MPRHRPQNYFPKYRKKSGLSQADLGELLGVTKSTVSKYENDICEPPMRRLLACEIIFGVPGSELLIAARDFVEDEISRRALALHDRIAGKTDAASQKKLALLNAIKDRVHAVRHGL